MRLRTWFRISLTAAFPLGVIIALNVERLAENRGWDTVLTDNWAGIVAWLSDPVNWVWAATFLAGGGAAALWLDLLLRKREPQATSKLLVEEEETFDPDWEDKLERIEGRYFNREEVRLDGRKFVACTFDDVTLVYDGGRIAVMHCKIGKHSIRCESHRMNRFIRTLAIFGHVGSTLFTETGPTTREDLLRQHGIRQGGPEPDFAPRMMPKRPEQPDG